MPSIGGAMPPPPSLRGASTTAPVTLDASTPDEYKMILLQMDG